MSELRAPDPTLANYEWDVLIEDARPPIAHRLDGNGCGAEWRHSDLDVQGSDRARWIAVPCRECFPNAPPLGHRFAATREDRWFAKNVHRSDAIPEPGLAWQTEGAS